MRRTGKQWEESLRRSKVFFITSRKEKLVRGVYFSLWWFLVWCYKNHLPINFETEVKSGRLDLGAWATKILPHLNEKQSHEVFEVVEECFGCSIAVSKAMATAQAA